MVLVEKLEWRFLWKSLLSRTITGYFFKSSIRLNNSRGYIPKKQKVHALKVINIELLNSKRSNSWLVCIGTIILLFFTSILLLSFHWWLLLVNTFLRIDLRVILDLDIWGKLINIAFLKIFTYELKLLLVLVSRQLLLLIYYQSISIFKSIFCSTFKIFCNLRPFFISFVFFNKFEQLNILIELPRPFFKLGTEVASPMLSTLLSISIHFLPIIIEDIQFLGYLFPIFYLRAFANFQPLIHNKR